jgi:hypothetical protein
MINGHVFEVCDLGTDRTKTVHAQYLKRYADSSLDVTTQLREFAAQGGRGYTVGSINSHRQHKGKWQLRVHWLGYDDPEEQTWEPMERLAEDVPVLVRRYVKSVTNGAEKAQMMKCLEGGKKGRKQ